VRKFYKKLFHGFCFLVQFEKIQETQICKQTVYYVIPATTIPNKKMYKEYTALSFYLFIWVSLWARSHAQIFFAWRNGKLFHSSWKEFSDFFVLDRRDHHARSARLL